MLKSEINVGWIVPTLTSDTIFTLKSRFSRKGDWIQTFTGKQFWPLDARVEEIDIHDIAHSLAFQCRFGGHCGRFYSVAEHCVLMLRYINSIAEGITHEVRLWALLHDATETYLVDLPRPVKNSIPDYKVIETNLMNVICDRFGMDHEMPKIVKEIDTRILMDEAYQNMKTPPQSWNDNVPPLGIQLQYWSPEEAEMWFLYEFDKLIGVKN